jgi:hypothetical protein
MNRQPKCRLCKRKIGILQKKGDICWECQLKPKGKWEITELG